MPQKKSKLACVDKSCLGKTSDRAVISVCLSDTDAYRRTRIIEEERRTSLPDKKSDDISNGERVWVRKRMRSPDVPHPPYSKGSCDGIIDLPMKKRRGRTPTPLGAVGAVGAVGSGGVSSVQLDDINNKTNKNKTINKNKTTNKNNTTNKNKTTTNRTVVTRVSRSTLNTHTHTHTPI
eukprot:GHVR01192262.1.p1 GENE.GHVR01192262.1~~GHVR01192262.1.p1  ORF type:complete len:186 (+),score=80.36 GHVR01192262.1:27-560(+)